MQPLSVFLSSLVQVLVCLALPSLAYAFRSKKEQSYARYIGFTIPPAQAFAYMIFMALPFLIAGTGLVFFHDGIEQAVADPGSVTGRLRQMGHTPATLFCLLLIAWIKTSLAEEIFFRNFLHRIFARMLGSTAGMVLQAFIFGLVHFLLFYFLIYHSLALSGFILVFTFLAGLGIGYVQLQYAKGSILPGWLAHGLGNMLSYLVIVYLI